MAKSDKYGTVAVCYYDTYYQDYRGKNYNYRYDMSVHDIEVYDDIIVPAGAGNRPVVVKVVKVAQGTIDPRATKEILISEFDIEGIEFAESDNYELVTKMLKLGIDSFEFEGDTIGTLEECDEEERNVIKTLLKEDTGEDKDMTTLENTFANNLFRKVDNVVLDLATGSLGLKSGSATYTYNEGVLTENPLDFFNMEFPGFAMSTELDKVNEGDMIINSEGRATGWITEILGDTYKVQNSDGSLVTFKPSTNTFMGGQRVMVVKNMFGSTEFGGIQGMLLPMMMMSGGAVSGDMEKMFMMLMLQNSGMMGASGGGDMMNLMMPMMMMKGLGLGS